MYTSFNAKRLSKITKHVEIESFWIGLRTHRGRSGWWCIRLGSSGIKFHYPLIRLTRLTLGCEVTRYMYRLVQVRQNLKKKDLSGWLPAFLHLFLFIIFFFLLPLFLKRKINTSSQARKMANKSYWRIRKEKKTTACRQRTWRARDQNGRFGVHPLGVNTSYHAESGSAWVLYALRHGIRWSMGASEWAFAE